MTYTPPEVLIREMHRRSRLMGRVFYTLIVMNVLLFGFIAYRTITDQADVPTVEAVE